MIKHKAKNAAKNTAKNDKKHIAVIGAGWAGCAAAVTLCQQGHQVTLIEASRTLGGRARAVEVDGRLVDNGQHILLGAYSACLELMRLLRIDLKEALLRLPLQMVYPHQTGIQFIAPKLPAPLHVLFALMSAKGLSGADKMALARFSTTARWIDWRLHQDCTVAELLERYEQTENLCRYMWNPLCIAALNTPPERASAQVFLNVLRDSLGANRAASDMLIPRHDLSRLLPDAAAEFIRQHGGQLITGVSIQSLKQQDNQSWRLESLRTKLDPTTAIEADPIANQQFDGIVIATSAKQAQRLLSAATIDTTNQARSDTTQASLTNMEFAYEPISTCYLQYSESLQLDRPFYALVDDPQQKHWAQFVFDRGQLNPAQAGLMAVVISASTAASSHSTSQVIADICQQLAQQLQNAAFATPVWTQVITEKRATFACTPNLKRPTNQTEIPGISLAGDFTASDYPATLESAVRSGIEAAKAWI